MTPGFLSGGTDGDYPKPFLRSTRQSRYHVVGLGADACGFPRLPGGALLFLGRDGRSAGSFCGHLPCESNLVRHAQFTLATLGSVHG